MIQTEHVPKEIVALAEQQLEDLKRRFPHISYSYCILRNHPDYITADPYHIRVEIRSTLLPLNRALGVSFLSNSIVIRTPPQYIGGSARYTMATTEVIDYADPKFTVDFISDMLERLR